MSLTLTSQQIQFKFCGKTSRVTPTLDANGNDQRHKGQITLDYIKLGLIGQAESSPFFVLGETSIKPWTWANATFVDDCDNNADPTGCSGCSTCKNPYYGNNIQIGTAEGKITGNFRMIGSNNNLYLQSTDSNLIVCYVTNKIDVSPYKGKRLEVSIKYAGNQTGPFSTRNIHFFYRYTFLDWPQSGQIFNKNSNFIGEYMDQYSLGVSVPQTATQDIDEISEMAINPNAVHDELNIKLNVTKALKCNLVIIDELGNEVLDRNENLDTGEVNIRVNINNIPAGIYFAKLSDQFGKIKTAKFTKQ